MSFACRIECDSVSPAGDRLTTMVVTYPRIIHAEMLTHRVFSRNSSSSRAIPVDKMIAAIEKDPYVPSVWGSNRRGMQAGVPVGNPEYCRMKWDHALSEAVISARSLVSAGVHKQIVNRLLEPFSWITVIITATEWDNFFALRCHPDAHPDMQTIAGMMRDALAASEPTPLNYGCWHLPFVLQSEWLRGIDDSKRISAGRCARVSYLTHDGKRDVEADLALAERLIVDKHSSPLEHQATPVRICDRVRGSFRGWRQFRHEIEG